LGIFKEIYKNHSNLVLEHFHHPLKISETHTKCSLPSALAPSTELLVSTNSPILDI
jgi:hypothetical protein